MREQASVCVCVLTKFDWESRRELHMTEFPQFVEVFVWSNNLQNVQQSAGERERDVILLKPQHIVSLMSHTVFRTHTYTSTFHENTAGS